MSSRGSTDMTLRSTVEGRVLYRLAEEGEVLGNGGKVLTLVNLGDVYMEIYLPAQDAVRVKIGADARIVLDIAPEYAARAKVSFVAPEAQFTPKQVETRSERDKLMFRVKLSVPPERVLPYIERVKTGIRGVGYVRLDDAIEWPERLDRQLPGRGPAAAGATSSRPNGTVESGLPAAPPKVPGIRPASRGEGGRTPGRRRNRPPSRNSRTRWPLPAFCRPGPSRGACGVGPRRLARLRNGARTRRPRRRDPGPAAWSA